MNKGRITALRFALYKEAFGISDLSEWVGERVIAPVGKGVGNYVTKNKKDGGLNGFIESAKNNPEAVKGIGKYVAGPFAQGFNESTGIGKEIKKTVAENTPAAAKAAVQQGTEQIRNMLGNAGEGWENFYGTNLDKLQEKLPEQYKGIIEKLKEHPYITPAVAAAIPIILYRIMSGRKEQEPKVVYVPQKTEGSAVVPLNKFY